MRRFAILLACVLVAPAIAVAEDEIEMDAVDAKPAKKPAKQPAKKAKPDGDGANPKPAKAAKTKRGPDEPANADGDPTPAKAKRGRGDADGADSRPTKAAKAKRGADPTSKAEARLAPEPEPTPAADPEPAPGVEPAVAASASASVSVDVRIGVKPTRGGQKRFYVRGGLAHIAPLSQSRELELADVDGAASLAIDNGPVAGSGASVSSATVFAATLGYRINDRFSVETVLGVPFTVKLRATGTLANESLAPTALGIPTGVPPLGSELGEAKAAPPVVTLVYNLRTRGALRPYVGAGASVLFAYEEKVTNPILTMVAEPDMSIAPAPGVVLQAGAEAKLWRNLYARADLKFIALMMARAKVEHIQVATPELPVFESVEVGTAKMNVWVNPLILQVGVGADF